MRFMRRTTGYTKWDRKKTEDILQERNVSSVLEYISRSIKLQGTRLKNVVMDMIKVDCEVDPLAIGEQKTLSEEANTSYQHVTEIKMEYNDYSCDLKSEITFRETPVLKSESEEGNSLGLRVTDIKTECMDHSYDMKPEMAFDVTPVPIDSPIVKREIEVGVDFEKEAKLEVTVQEDEVLNER
ncbi:hypothetical protein ANN_27500 [Periplaneta americana]|uniref:Uncharacterized protein n=1 Tax=Periplaneta americana TaxID=6978 RepID=A0ABQ8RVY5_PERAM|nr:hypothetical protein ANN_27500 [Periplaneta americana]